MELKIATYILAECGVTVLQLLNGRLLFYTEHTKKQITDDEAVELMIDYLTTRIADKLKPSHLLFETEEEEEIEF